MAKRASTDYSFIVGVDKPAGLTSHDVVNKVRRIYGERRVGHTGTLDPAATGALLVCVGPATRFDQFLAGHSKIYDFSVVFGTQTSTDDAEGEVIAEEAVPEQVLDANYAREALSWMLGSQEQLPPAYSAIKVGGVKAYDAARAGKALDLRPRKIEVYSCELLGIDATDADHPVWQVRAHVSAGTYVRSLARDLGHTVGTVAHVGSLRRVRTGKLDVAACVSLEELERNPHAYQLDPVKLLGVPLAFVEGEQTKAVQNGAALPASTLELFEYEPSQSIDAEYCACSSGLRPCAVQPADGDIIALISDNKLVAIYAYHEAKDVFKSACGFSKGVARGAVF